MCSIFVGSVHDFGRSDDDIVKCKNADFPTCIRTWFDAQLDQKILDGLSCRRWSKQNLGQCANVKFKEKCILKDCLIHLRDGAVDICDLITFSN